VRAIPVPTLESLAPARIEPRPVEMVPAPEIRMAPPAPAPVPVPRVETRPAPRIEPAASAPQAPAATQTPAAASSARPAASAPERGAFPREPRRESGRPASDYDPTAPSLDLDAIRNRAGEIAREGSGQSAILAFPMPPVPEKKSKMETAIENARKPDCRTAYQGLGLAAIVPLIANEFGEGSCRW
jgi:hypothetical protein